MPLHTSKPLSARIGTPRPFAVYYPGDSVGHCATLHNAILRGTRALLDHRYDGEKHIQVNILRDGNHLMDLYRTPNSVVIRYTSATLPL